MSTSLREIFDHLEQRSTKWDSYFPVYEQLLQPYRNRAITFVEIGVLNGGSLQMWRAFLGEQARIIGIDLNPAARQMEAQGFEIFIGDQADPAFWQSFFEQVGEIDVLIDDGGHRNDQQIITLESALPQVRDGGLILVEDVHTAYLRAFGNPSPYSFLNYAKRQIDRINQRSGKLPPPKRLEARIWGIRFYESLVVFEINRSRCQRSREVIGGTESFQAQDFRFYQDESPRLRRLQDLASRYLGRFASRQVRSLQKRYRALVQWRRNRRMKRFFDGRA